MIPLRVVPAPDRGRGQVAAGTPRRGSPPLCHLLHDLLEHLSGVVLSALGLCSLGQRLACALQVHPPAHGLEVLVRQRGRFAALPVSVVMVSDLLMISSLAPVARHVTLLFVRCREGWFMAPTTWEACGASDDGKPGRCCATRLRSPGRGGGTAWG